jgi:hypothetical protein
MLAASRASETDGVNRGLLGAQTEPSSLTRLLAPNRSTERLETLVECGKDPSGVPACLCVRWLGGPSLLSGQPDDEALSEASKWVAYTLPAFLIWLVGIWLWFLLRVPSELAFANEQTSQNLGSRVRELEERLLPRLRIEGGNGPDFDWDVPAMRVYELLEKAHALASGEYVMRPGYMKVLRISNPSDVGIDEVRVEVTLDKRTIPVRLTWTHNQQEIADIAPRGARHVLVAMKAELGFSLAGGRERIYERGLWYHDLASGTILRVKAWTPGGPAVSKAYRVGGGLMSLLPETQSPIILTEIVEESPPE